MDHSNHTGDPSVNILVNDERIQIGDNHPMDERGPWPNNLAPVMERMGHTQTSLAKRLGWNKQRAHKYWHEDRKLTVQYAKQIGEAFSIPWVELLIYGDDDLPIGIDQRASIGGIKPAPANGVIDTPSGPGAPNQLDEVELLSFWRRLKLPVKAAVLVIVHAAAGGEDPSTRETDDSRAGGR
jgi:transcriptional regulator with XRE-family HTH domain